MAIRTGKLKQIIMNYLKPLLKQRLLIVCTITLLVTGCSSPTGNETTVAENENSAFNPNNMAIKAIIELQAHPGKRDELKAFIENLVATHGPGGPGFIRSTRYEVLDNPDRLIEIAEWESAEAREAHIKAAAATGIYAPLKELLAEPFRVTIIKQLDY
jgi:quinol monooxygenase YgiN